MDKQIDFEEQYDKIYRYCYFKLHHREKAEDITQETFLRFLESATYHNTGRALQYLYMVARNLCIDEYRKGQREYLVEEFTGESAAFGGMTAGGDGIFLPGNAGRAYVADSAEEGLLTRVTVSAALQELSPEERELILLRYVNEVPVSVIGKLFGMSRFAVYRRIKEALSLLQEKLGEEDFV